MKLSKNLIVILSSTTLLLGACGGGNEKNAGPKDTTANTTPSTTGSAASSNPANDKAIDLIASSDCTTCHRLHQASGGAQIGPAYDQVAAKYNPAADTTITRLVNKIISGGTGIWGTTPMTPHPTLSRDDAKAIVTYILTLKQS